MSSPRKPGFYAANAVRAYPLDDAATAATDEGLLLPADIFVGCTLRWPSALGTRACLVGLTISPWLVTATFGVWQPQDDSLAPLGAISARRPAPEGIPIPLQPAVPGVGGWLVLGPGVREVFRGRFSTKAQGLLLSTCARPYPVPPVPSLSKFGVATTLTGTVELEGAGDLRIAYERVPILDTPDQDPSTARIVRAAVFRLVGATDGPIRDIQAAYIGPCGGRPESGSCARPSVQSIGGAIPDCDGVVNLQLYGAWATPLAGGAAGFLLDLDASLASACARSRPPVSRLLAQYSDECSSSASASAEPDSEPGEPEPDPYIGEPAGTPYVVSFAAGDPLDDGWSIASGSFTQDLDLGRWYAEHPGRRNVAIYARFNHTQTETAINKRASVTLRLEAAGAAVQRNGGLVVNYLPADAQRRLPAYHLVLLNAVTNALEVWYSGERTGGRLVRLAAAAAPFATPVQLGQSYALTAELRQPAGPDGLLELTCEAISESDPFWPPVSLAHRDLLLDTGDGKPGVASYQARASFQAFAFEDI